MNPEKKPLTEEERKEIFLALVKAQDERNMTVPRSRKAIAVEFGVREQQVMAIEREGLDAEWPPLGSGSD